GTTSGKLCRLLQVVLHLFDRARLDLLRRDAGLLRRAPAAQQVPELVELLFDATEPLVLLLLGDLARLELGTEAVLLAHELRDVFEQRLVIHRRIIQHPQSHTGSGVSTTSPSPLNSRYRSNERVNHRSWVTAITVPWKASSPS